MNMNSHEEYVKVLGLLEKKVFMLQDIWPVRFEYFFQDENASDFPDFFEWLENKIKITAP